MHKLIRWYTNDFGLPGQLSYAERCELMDLSSDLRVVFAGLTPHGPPCRDGAGS